MPSGGEAVAMGVKARVLYSRLLSDEDYNVLLHSDSISGIAGILKTTEAYKDQMSLLPPARVHRIDLENAVRSSILNAAESFLPYLGGARRALFDDWLNWYETENLKSIFRWIRSRRLDREQMKQRLYPVPGSKVSYDLLLNSKNFDEVLEALSGTKYYKPIKAAVKRLTEGEESLFSLELALDNFVEMSIYRDMRKLEPGERGLLRPFFGTRVDLINLYNLVRCLLYYRMSLEETLSRMLPVKYMIKTSDLRSVAKGATWEERLDRLENISPVYAKVFSEAWQKTNFELSLERSVSRFSYFKALTVFHTGSPGFHTAMAFFLLKSYEVSDIIKIIEDVRYDYDRRNAARYLIRPITVTGGEPAWR